jgi:hypothetical protein
MNGTQEIEAFARHVVKSVLYEGFREHVGFQIKGARSLFGRFVVDVETARLTELKRLEINISPRKLPLSQIQFWRWFSFAYLDEARNNGYGKICEQAWRIINIISCRCKRKGCLGWRIADDMLCPFCAGVSKTIQSGERCQLWECSSCSRTAITDSGRVVALPTLWYLSESGKICEVFRPFA